MSPLIRRKGHLLQQLSPDKKNTALKKDINSVQWDLDEILDEFFEFSNSIFEIHVELVNKYLEKFTSYITLKEFSHLKNNSDLEMFRIFPVFEVHKKKVVFASPIRSAEMSNAKFSMSEGDKSTIALCFFLARLEFLGVEGKIIVFDDPLSSFDYSRRNATIYQLNKIVNSAEQFILLSHDLGFVADFKDKCSYTEQITLKIGNDGTTSFLDKNELNSEFLTNT